MSTSFETFWERFKNPTSPLAKAIRAISSTSAEKVDVEYYEEFVLNYKNKNTDLTGAEECTLAEIEIFIENAKKVQEESEQEWENIMNNSEHPKHSEYKNKFEGEK